MKNLLTVTVALALSANISGRAESPLSQASRAALVDCAGKSTPTLPQRARDAVSEDPGVAESAIRALRVQGPEGLRTLLETHAETIKLHTAPRLAFSGATNDAAWARLRTAIDGVGQQRDCYASRLFWHTDFDQAKAAAKASGKPILSLRLLGRLDEEFSCANSRFFRTTLYANTEVANYLRDHYVLHWKSVRPVPKVTIDFGDGRKLEQTLTGNSIHYVLDSDGGLVDALPGLYGARSFLQELERGAKAVKATAPLTAPARAEFLREFHRTRTAALNEEFAAVLQRVNSQPPVTFASNPPSAREASLRATAKGRVERPLLPSPRTSELDDATWQKIAALRPDAARLDQSSAALILAKAPTAVQAAALTVGKSIAETPLLRQIRNLERAISEDTARNEYLFHLKIHEWLSTENAGTTLDQFNARVYAELFLTPDTDPWLGLLPTDNYAALENNGIVVTNKK